MPGADAKGGRDSAAVTTKEACCTACEGHADCAAGVFDGKTCWFKTAKEVAGGCQHSSRSKFACVTPGHGPPAPPPPPSAHQLALEKQYTDQKNATCTKVRAKLPQLDSSAQAAFMAAYANLAKNKSDTAPVLAAAQTLLDAADVKAFLSNPDSWVAGGLDADLAICTIMSDATPRGLASRRRDCHLMAHPPVPLSRVSIGINRGCHRNDSHADG